MAPPEAAEPATMSSATVGNAPSARYMAPPKGDVPPPSASQPGATALGTRLPDTEANRIKKDTQQGKAQE